MDVQTASLQAELSALVGAEHVRRAGTADMIAGVQPHLLVEPGTVPEVAEILRFANASGLHVAPCGGGSKLAWGNAPRGVDLVLGTRRLDQVLEHAWGDMTATVQAGCTIAKVQQVLAEHGQQLALDPLWPERATIGGILATNDSGSLRIRYGSLRDLVIGMTVVLPDGTVARSGGKVVKNVAGYDLPKLMTGALGTLGIIVEATFRLYPLPVATRTVTIAPPTVAEAQAVALSVLDSTLAPAGVQLHLGHAVHPLVAIRLHGIPAALDIQTEQLVRMAAAVDATAVRTASEELWHAREPLWDGVDRTLIAKVSTLPTNQTSLVEAIARVAGPLRLEWKLVMQAVGVGVLRLDGANEQVLLAALSLLRTALRAMDGSLVVLHCPPQVQERIDMWGMEDDSLLLMRRVKAQFDPHGVLNPGRFVGGI